MEALGQEDSKVLQRTKFAHAEKQIISTIFRGLTLCPYLLLGGVVLLKEVIFKSILSHISTHISPHQLFFK